MSSRIAFQRLESRVGLDLNGKTLEEFCDRLSSEAEKERDEIKSGLEVNDDEQVLHCR